MKRDIRKYVKEVGSAAVFRDKALTTHCTLPAHQQTANWRLAGENMVVHLAVKETDISLRRPNCM